jgi:Fe-S oxidoreductase
MRASSVFFAICLLAAGLFFANSARRLIRWLQIGKAEPRTDQLGTRIRNFLSIGILQTKILRDPVGGLMHALVFWGFCILTLGTIEILLQGIIQRDGADGFRELFTYGWFLPSWLYAVYSASQEFFALVVLTAVAWLVYRRLVIKPARFRGDPIHGGDALFILGMIATLMLTLLLNGAMEHVFRGSQPGRFVSGAVGRLFESMKPGTAHTVFTVSWWSHALLILYFANYLPFSKHLHVLTSLINVFFSNTSGPGVVGAMRPMNLEDENAEQFGASDIEHLSWKSLLDGYSCTECGRCTAACPANITGKVLSPRMIVVKTRARLTEAAPLLVSMAEAKSAGTALAEPDEATQKLLGNKLLDNFITEEELWACTSCRACVVECPVSIDQLDVINELRRNLVLMESRFPEEIQPAFQSLERNGSPWAFSPADRANWAEGLDIPTMAEAFERGERPALLFWVGCMGSFDDRARKTSVAFAKILKAADVSFAILGQEESCHGDPARRMGNEYLYQMLAKQAIETMDRYEVKTVVTFCPHCFHQMGKEFPFLGGNYTVIHHADYIKQLLDEGRVPLDSAEGKHLKMVYHDSCYLGRYNEIYESPRATLRKALPVVTLVEPERTKSRGLCCGAGGGRMWMEETAGKRINVERTEELLATGADAIAVACPFCMTMMTDGVTAQGKDTPVLDIAEVVAERLAPAAVSASG